MLPNPARVGLAMKRQMLLGRRMDNGMLKPAYSAAVGLITMSLNGIEISRPGKVMSRVAVEFVTSQAQT
jgi:hypothetical protein